MWGLSSRWSLGTLKLPKNKIKLSQTDMAACFLWTEILCDFASNVLANLMNTLLQLLQNMNKSWKINKSKPMISFSLHSLLPTKYTNNPFSYGPAIEAIYSTQCWSYLFVASNILKVILVVSFCLYKIGDLTCGNKKPVSALTITTLKSHTERYTHTERWQGRLRKGREKVRRGGWALGWGVGWR